MIVLCGNDNGSGNHSLDISNLLETNIDVKNKCFQKTDIVELTSRKMKSGMINRCRWF